VASEDDGAGMVWVAAALDCAEGCDSDGCCAAALTETSSAAVNINFQVRMTLFSIKQLSVVSCHPPALADLTGHWPLATVLVRHLKKHVHDRG
jgi:hypothetical protein